MQTLDALSSGEMEGIECGRQMTATGEEAFFALKDPETGDAPVSPSNKQVPAQHPELKQYRNTSRAAWALRKTFAFFARRNPSQVPGLFIGQ